ncbi:hypothetical protein AB833_15555 [Chromatiales bacterium (ex Bugula neritina AB1)]|nr:hypothetical protein AB833_15555 [Chromatiales bacterium (ex Bugula neritina AB1)]
MKKLLEAIQQAGGTPLKVGGCVRDNLLGIDNKDVDIEVYGLPYDQLVRVLEKFGRVATVGRSFGVIKLWHEGEEYDFSLPRRDSKTGRGHKGFVVEHDHSLSPREAAMRRDYTINSMAESTDGELIDPFNGADDLRAKILRATSPQFVEDPLRVLRGMQFAARFEMRVEAQTAEMCRTLAGEFDTLAIERIWTEFVKLCCKGQQPGLGIQFLIDTGWLELFPQLQDMHNSPQDPEWHPEGCVLTHTMHCMNAAVEVADREGIEGEDRLVLVLALLCHDIGKPVTLAKNEAGRYTNFGHAEKGVPIAEDFLKSIGATTRVIERVLPLVKYHMVHLSLEIDNISHRFVRRLARNLGSATISELAMVMEADKSGRPPLAKGAHPTSVEIVKLAEELALQHEPPMPIVQGRDLIRHFGVKGGPSFRKVLDAAFEAQLNGEFDNVTDGINYLRQHRLAEGL